MKHSECNDAFMFFVFVLDLNKNEYTNNLNELFLKVEGEKLPCCQYPAQEIRGKRYYTL